MGHLFFQSFLNPKSRLLAGTALFAFALIATIIFPHHAFAASGEALSLGDIMCGVTVNLLPNSVGGGGGWGIVKLIISLCYCGGIFFVGTGLHQLSRRAEGDREVKFHHPMARLIGGTFLISLPNVLAWIMSTLFLVPQGGGVYGASPCNGGSSTWQPTGGNGLTPEYMIQNLVENIREPMTLMLSIMATIIGLVLIYKGLVKSTKYGTDPKAYSIPNILANLIVGCILFTTGTSFDLVSNTLLGDNHVYQTSSAFWSYMAGSPFLSQFSPDQLVSFETTVGYCLNFFQLIGIIGFIRGWLILKSSVEGSGQATIAQGLTHIFGGAMAINIFQILEIFNYTFTGT
jgi:hypothetical protein